MPNDNIVQGYEMQELVNTVVKLRTEKGWSTKTIIQDYLIGQIGYKRSMAYVIMKKAQNEIKEMWSKEHVGHLENAVAQLEELYENAIERKKFTEALEIRKEMNKITGLHSNRIDLTSGGEPITSIKLIEVKGNSPVVKEDDGEDA